MEKIAFFDAKPYDKEWFDKINKKYEIVYYESRLRPESARLAEGCTAVCAFVNDVINAKTIDTLVGLGVKVLLMRCAGFNNIALAAAKDRIKILRVPAYSPYAVAEHAMGMILALNRKIPRAYIRTRDFNFSLVGLTGFDLHGKTAGIIGTGKIGLAFMEICKGFGMNILAYDPHPADIEGAKYVDTDELFNECIADPLNKGVTFSGGEPFCQPKPLYELGRRFKERGLSLWCYSGWTWKELWRQAEMKDDVAHLLSILDVLVDGRFIEERKSLSLPFRGSDNQRLIDVPLSLKEGIVIEYEA